MTILTPRVEVPRDRFGRPLITPPDGGQPVPYVRATTWAKTLDDMWGLTNWKLRQTAVGLADRPDLMLAVTTQRDDKKALDATVQEAMEAAKSKAGATTGTALHKLTEYVDRGEDLPTIPPETLADLAAYEDATKGLEVVAIEQFVVVDDLQVAGTFDRIVQWQGRNYIADLKTSRTVDYGMGSIAIQLALYSRGALYDHLTGTRDPLNVDQDKALVYHLPAGSGQCRILTVDINLGWAAALLAGRVRKFRTFAKQGLRYEGTP